MIQTEINRAAKKEGEKIVVESKVVEKMDKQDFTNTYMQINSQVHMIEGQIGQLKQQLKGLEDIEETEEIKKFKDIIDKANKLIEKEKLIKQLQKQEITLAERKKELTDFKRIYKENISDN